MEFRTEMPASNFSFDITHNTPVLTVGSCFAENIGNRLASLKFRSLVNPFGIVYNPVSVGGVLKRLLDEDFTYPREALFENQGLWHSFEHHSRFSATDPDHVLKGINKALRLGREFLRESKVVFLTFGTAYVFERRKDGGIVANCHKVPAHQFCRRRLSVEEVKQAIGPHLLALKQKYPAIDIVLTVSPVRHLRDGFVCNQRSKAVLLLGAGELCDEHEFVHYFPAYELLLDDLRDYRFYDKDLVHPAEIALEYIWNHFKRSFFTERTRRILADLHKIQRSADHRTMFPGSPGHVQFVERQLEKMDRFEKSNPKISLAKEREKLQNQGGGVGKNPSPPPVI